jgi:hypothetical protein
LTNVTDGTPIDYALAGLPLKFRAYAHEGGVIAIYDPKQDKHVAINVIGMTKDEIERATRAASALLEASKLYG